MATVIGLRFPWGRYHATPWGHSVNEAAIEWPPSPWRLLRALYCTWRFRAPELHADDVTRLLGLLVEPPSYALPRHLEAHTRHYMPDTNDEPDKVFDPFAVLSRNAEVLVRWDTDLDNTDRRTLERLVDLLPYLGRAESVCEGRLLEDEPSQARWIFPDTSGAAPGPSLRLLAAATPLDLSALTLTTTAVRRSARLLPPGTRQVSYSAPPSKLEPRKTSSRPRQPVEIVRLVVDGDAAPSMYAAVAACDLLRRAAMHTFGTPPSPVLAGKDNSGAPLRGKHEHAHYLALDLDGDRLIDRLVVWAPAGLGDAEVRALSALRRLSTGQPVDGLHPIRVALEAAGSSSAAVPELSSASHSWVSHTPFAPTRHQSRRQSYEDFIRAEVARELSARSLPEAEVEPLPAKEWLRFRRRRLSEPLGLDRRAVGLRLTFAAPVRGPISLGALSHFGLGLFLPESRAQQV